MEGSGCKELHGIGRGALCWRRVLRTIPSGNRPRAQVKFISLDPGTLELGDLDPSVGWSSQGTSRGSDGPGGLQGPGKG